MKKFVVIQGQAVTSGCRGLDADPLQGHMRPGMADSGQPGVGGRSQRRKAVQPHQADSRGLRTIILCAPTFERMTEEQERQAVLAFVNLLVPHLERKAA